MRPLRIPLRHYLLLSCALFIGVTYFAGKLLWSGLERYWISPMKQENELLLPVLVQAEEGKYLCIRSDEVSPSMNRVLWVNSSNLDQINADLSESIRRETVFPYVKIRSSEGFSLEVPTRSESKQIVWYEMKKGRLIATQRLLYGPGYAFVVLGAVVVCSLFSLALLTIFVRPSR